MDEGNHQEALDEDVVQSPRGQERCMRKTFEKNAQSLKKITVDGRLTVVRKAIVATVATAGDNDLLGVKIYSFYLQMKRYRHAEKRIAN